MKREPLWQISLVTSLEAEDAVVELLGRVFNRSTAVYTNEKTHVTVASVYCQQRNDFSPREAAALKAALNLMRATGLNCGPGKITVRRVAREDWSESWKRHFKPIEIGSSLLIKPSWIKRRPRKNQAVVILDPGLSFGTGNHPTTAFCLQELAACRKVSEAQSFWDLGTGSGILAIAAVELGYKPVRAVDFDQEAVRVARENARQNGVSKQLRPVRQDVTKISLASRQQYDFICANLISNLLIAERQRIINRLRPKGRLVLAGILKQEFAQVKLAYEQAGMKLAHSRVEKEWRSGSFVFSKRDSK